MAASSSVGHKPTVHQSLNTDPQFLDNAPPLLTYAGEVLAKTMFGNDSTAERIMDAIRVYFFNLQDNPEADVPEGQLKTVLQLKENLTFFHINKSVYVVSSEVEFESKYKSLFIGININTCEQTAVLTSTSPQTIDELKIMNDLSPSPYILPIWESVEQEKVVYIFTPFCNKGDLRCYEKRIGKRSMLTQLKVVRDILRGLEHIHNHGIIHGDIKPENILVDIRENEKGKIVTKIKIADFGSACHVDDHLGKLFYLHGTMDFQSPEQSDNFIHYIKNRTLIHSSNPPSEDLLEPAKLIKTSSDIYSLSIAIQEIFFDHSKQPITSNYWARNWCHESKLQAMDPFQRPTAARCLRRIRPAIRAESKLYKETKAIQNSRT